MSLDAKWSAGNIGTLQNEETDGGWHKTIKNKSNI